MVDGLHTYRGRGEAQISMNNQSYTAEIDISARFPDSLRVKVTGPFGILMGVLRASRTEYEAYNAIENTVMRGRLDPSKPLPFPGFSLLFDDAMNFVRGIPGSPLDTVHVEEAPLVLECTDAHGRAMRCEARDAHELRVRVRDTTGAEAYQVFSGYERIDGYYLPKKRTASMPARGRVALDLDEQLVNTTDLDFSFSVPTSAARIDR